MHQTPAVVRHFAQLTLRSRALLFTAPPITLGTITLLAHQTAAVHWLLRRMDRYGGALLADPPGLGKTYVALAIAAARSVRPLIIAPASLRTRWRDAEHETGVAVDFISTERLSAPAALHPPFSPLVIIDEAHHLRTPHTRRHQRTIAICEHAEVLLLSATPIHNREADLENIAALFHVPAARANATLLRRRLTLRRSLVDIQSAGGRIAAEHAIPAVRIRRTFTFAAQPTPVPQAILELPPLTTDAPESHRLLQIGFLHALRSSDAAALERIRRRIAVTLAVEHAAVARVEATASLRRAFQSQHGDVQLAMSAVLASQSRDVDPQAEYAAVRQRQALEAVLPALTGDRDRARAAALRRIARWVEQPVVAFTQFHATARAFYSRLRDRPGIAWLGGTTAHITSGVISRDEVIHRLLSPRSLARHDGVRLLITTDVLSEGLSLTGVATIVHLDLPWTAARIDQRIGRAARIGAPVTTVNVVHMPAPLPETLHATVSALIRTKRHRMSLLDGAGDDDTATVLTLRRLCDAAAAQHSSARWVTMASLTVRRPLTLAKVRIAGRLLLVACDDDEVRRPNARDWHAVISASVVAQRPGCIAALRHRLHGWHMEHELTTIVSDPRDRRLHARRGVDEALCAPDRLTRATRAALATVSRRTLMHSSRRADVGGRGDDTSASIAPADTPNVRCGPRSRAILVLAVLNIVPLQ